MYDITKDYNREFPGEGPFFTDYLQNIINDGLEYGLNYVDWHADIYPNLYAHKDTLVDRFNREYAFREIGQETVNRWHHFLQCRFDEVADHFNHMYKVFEENNVDELGTGYSYQETLNQTKTGSVASTNKNSSDSKFADTPGSTSSTINNPTSQNIDESEQTGSTNTTDSNDYQKTIKRTDHQEHMIEELNKLTDNYKSIDNEFIQSFENMFMGIEEVVW